MQDNGFTSFRCDHCHTEIEATADMIGEEAECPACGARLTVPDNRSADGITRHGLDDRFDTAVTKSRTIRIELGDL